MSKVKLKDILLVYVKPYITHKALHAQVMLLNNNKGKDISIFLYFCSEAIKSTIILREI